MDKRLDLKRQKLRLPTLIRILLWVPAVITLHARRLYLRLPVYMKEIASAYEEVLKKISGFNTIFSKNSEQLPFAEIVFRREWAATNIVSSDKTHSLAKQERSHKLWLRESLRLIDEKESGNTINNIHETNNTSSKPPKNQTKAPLSPAMILIRSQTRK